MEIYEKRHLFDAGLSVIVDLCMIVFGFALLCTGREAWWRFPDWAWVCGLVVGAIFVLLGVTILCLRVNRYIKIHAGGIPVAIISKDCLQVFSAFGGYETIYWNEVVDFKIYYSRGGNSCRPVFKDDSRNRGIINFYRTALFCSHLTLSEQELLEELKKHIIKV